MSLRCCKKKVKTKKKKRKKMYSVCTPDNPNNDIAVHALHGTVSELISATPNYW